MSCRRLPTLLLLGSLLLTTVACGSTNSYGPPGRRMSFAAMQSINPGVEGEWIVEEFPFARGVNRRTDGSLQMASYEVQDPQGKNRRLTLHFDQTGMLVRKQYAGPLIRPPEPDDVDLKLRGNSSPGSEAQHPYYTPAGYTQSGGGNAGPTAPNRPATAPQR